MDEFWKIVDENTSLTRGQRVATAVTVLFIATTALLMLGLLLAAVVFAWRKAL